MKFTIREWSLRYLYTVRSRINFPVYQRAAIWDTERQRLLIDSVFQGIDIPKLYLQKVGADEWDCIDGHQRIQAITGYFDGLFEYNDHTFEDMSPQEKAQFEDYKLTITEIEQIDEEEVRLLFKRLNLGIPLNAGEKLNAVKSNLGDFVRKMTEHPFIRNVSIPTRRFAKEQVCAQICNNSVFINRTGDYRNSKYEDLENLYRAYADFDTTSPAAAGIMGVLDCLDRTFDEEARDITNRASVVSIYLFVENLIQTGEITDSTRLVKDFFLRFTSEVRNESRLGIDATSRFLVSYQSRIIQAADSRTSISERATKLRWAFDEYRRTGQIPR